ncbi:hypothetical protein C8R43DRAFT_1132186 [Mycena crocata]|nr:hypothetical protein C8R43DRAFT_1132186 [Mycena crocata]
MAKTTRSSSNTKSPRTPRKKPISKSMIDDEAEASDDGVLVDKDEGPDEAGEDTRSEGYEEEFINDGDPFDGASNSSDDGTPPASIMAEYKPKTYRSDPSAGRTKAPASKVIDILSSSDEDMEAMDADDSMFKQPSGVKASALPPSLSTRSSKRIAADNSDGAASPSPKKPKLSSKISGKRPDLKSLGLDPKMLAFLESCVAGFEDSDEGGDAGRPSTPSSTKQTRVSDPPPSPSPAKNRRIVSPATPSPVKKKGKRVDFDQVELEMGLQASQSGGSKTRSVKSSENLVTKDDDNEADFSPVHLERAIHLSKLDARSKQLRGSGSKKETGRLYTLSPDWLPPYDGICSPPPPSSVPASYGTQSIKSKMGSAAGKGRDKSVANDIISRMQAGEDVGKAEDEGDTPAGTRDIASFMNRPKVLIPALHHLDPARPMSMRQYFDTFGTEPPPPLTVEPVPEDDFEDDEDPTVFLETLETYKSHYNPRAPCGVNDLDLQDPVLRNSYVGQPPLPLAADRAIVPVFDPTRLNGEELAPIKGGRVKFITWLNHLPGMNANNAFNSILFVEALGRYMNPSRSSPVKASVQLTSGANPSKRLNFNDHIAICVSALFCTESFVTQPKKIGASSDRLRKWVSGVFHNQEWERFESYMSLVFGEPLLHAQLSPEKALSFQSMMSPAADNTSRGTAHTFAKDAPADMFAPMAATTSPAKPKISSKKWTGTTKTLLSYDDTIPVYDARRTVIDWDKDLGRLDEALPRFNGEVPFASFIVVGYSVSCYNNALSGGSEKVPHLGCNLVWIIVVGTPALKSKKDKEKAV